jgi:hypothetical protein
MMHKGLFHNRSGKKWWMYTRQTLFYFGKFVGCRPDPWKCGKFLTIVPQKFGPTYAGTEILETLTAGTTYLMHNHSFITTLNIASVLYKQATSTGTFCDNCSAEDNDKSNVIF